MSRLTWCVLLAVAASGCRRNDNFCESANPNNNCSEIDAAIDSPMACTTSAECTPQVCDLTGSMTCVQCTPGEDAACTGTTPACVSNTCQACASHAQCDSAVCLSDGSCATENEVAYVSPSGTDNAACTQATPCTKVTKALATNRKLVKFTGITDEGGTVVVDNQNVALVAEPNAKLVRTSNGIVLEVKGTSQVAIFDLEVSGGSGSQGIGISLPAGNTASLRLTRAKVLNNTGGGVSSSGGSLAVSQSTISSNTGGGIFVMNGTFAIVGNVFVNNGTQTGSVGGLSIAASQNAANRLEFNSFNSNQVQVGFGSALQCTAGTFTARNNIMSENGSLANMEQSGGTCGHAYSIVRPGMPPLGTGNSAANPMFVNTATGDLHIQSGSPARGAADPASDLTGLAARDIDGDTRGMPADIGADEVP